MVHVEQNTLVRVGKLTISLADYCERMVLNSISVYLYIFHRIEWVFILGNFDP